MPTLVKPACFICTTRETAGGHLYPSRSFGFSRSLPEDALKRWSRHVMAATMAPICPSCAVAYVPMGPLYNEPAGDARTAAVDDPVSHPAHYTFGKYEVIDVIEGWGFGADFTIANVIKYVARARHKGSELTDLRKAAWYLNRRIQQLEQAQLDEPPVRTVDGDPKDRGR